MRGLYDRRGGVADSTAPMATAYISGGRLT
jgi:hypothetical protein